MSGNKEVVAVNIAFACDHAGITYKNKIIGFIETLGHKVVDFGCYGTESCDYPDFGMAAAQAVSQGKCERGVLICGTGVGMSIVANKFPGVRAAVCWSDTVAGLAAEHNHANILCLPARFASAEQLALWIETWLKTPFSTEKRHKQRINKITELEKKLNKTSL